MTPTEIYKTDGGYRKYRQSLLLVFFAAANRVMRNPVFSVRQSVNRATYIEFDRADTAHLADKIKSEMRSLVGADFPLKTVKVSQKEASRLYREAGQTEEAKKILLTPRTEDISLFCDSGRYYGVYGEVFPSAGDLSDFDLIEFETGLLLRYPHPSYGAYPPFSSGIKILKTIEDYRDWHSLAGVTDVFELNYLIKSGEIQPLVNVAEIMHEKVLSEIAQTIKQEILEKRVILISGPSSSGKTTFAKRLMLHLRVCGIKPVVISLDDYFVDRDKTPLDEDGEPNYEDIDCLDYELFRSQLAKIIRGDVVYAPRFDFEQNKSIPGSRVIKLEAGSVVIVEGLHALSHTLTAGIPSKALYKVYCSALTCLCFDKYNPISPTDTRLIRRIIRDRKYRSCPAAQTIGMWDSVSRGEVKNVFPYEDDADYIFNSSLAYEFSVYKTEAESLLREADRELGGNYRCRRLLELLSYFEPLDTSVVPPMSVLREFVGGLSV